MSTVWDRRNRRINYQVPVGVYDLNAEKVLDMSSVNVSRGGMFIDTEKPLPVGSHVVCNLPYGRDQESLQLRGRVAWLRHGTSDKASPRGIGVQFVNLSDNESDQLSEIVGRNEERSHSIEVHIPGMEDTFSAEAHMSNEGLYFRSQLPFLALESEVEFEFSEDGDGARYRAEIASVRVHQDPGSSIPRLQVELRRVDEDAPPAIPELSQEEDSVGICQVIQIDAADTVPNTIDSALNQAIGDAIDSMVPELDEALLQPEETSFAELSEDDDAYKDDDAYEVDPVAHESGEHNTERGFAMQSEAQEEEQLEIEEEEPEYVEIEEEEPDLSAVATTLVEPEETGPTFGEATELPDASEGPKFGVVVTVQTGKGTERIEHSAKTRPWIMPSILAAGLVAAGFVFIGDSKPTLAEKTRADNAEEVERVRALIEKAPAQPLLAAEVVEEVEPEPELEAFQASVQDDVEDELEASLAPRPKSREVIGGLVIRENEGKLLIRLPINGSAKDAKDYPLAGPRGLAINVPNATPVHGFHSKLSPKNDRVPMLRLKERQGGLQLRVFLDADVPSCKVEYSTSQIVIRCQP